MTRADGPDVAVLPSPPEDDSPAPAPASGGPAFCLVAGARDGFAGGVMGSVFGFGQGLWKKQGFKGSLKEARSSAKTFALLSGVHTVVTCILTKIRGKHDEINAGIAGCATGIALSIPGSPDAVLRSCVTFAAFSYIVERFNKPQAAMACPYDEFAVLEKERVPEKGFSFSVLPPFVLAPTYLESLQVSKRTNFVKYTLSKF